MSDKVKYAKEYAGNNYDATYVNVETIPSVGVDSSTRRAKFNGLDSRVFLGMNSDSFTNYLFACIFKRGSTNPTREDDKVAEHIWTTYRTPEGVRLAVGIDKDVLSVAYWDTFQKLYVKVSGYTYIGATKDYHLSVVLIRTANSDGKIIVVLDGKEEIKIDLVRALPAPGLTNPYLGGDGNRHNFHGEIDFPAVTAPHYSFTDGSRGYIGYFNVVAKNSPDRYTAYSAFDPVSSSSAMTIGHGGYEVSCAMPGYHSAILDQSFSNTEKSSVEFEIVDTAQASRYGMTLLPYFDPDSVTPLGDFLGSISITTLGEVSYTSPTGATTKTQTSNFPILGDVIRFDYDPITSDVEIFRNNVSLFTGSINSGTWYAAASLRTGVARVNTGVRHFRMPAMPVVPTYHRYTEDESAAIYSRVMPIDAYDSVKQVSILFRDSLLGTDLRDESTGEIIGEYLGAVYRQQTSLSPDSAGVSTRLAGGRVVMNDVAITSLGYQLSVHLALRLEYTDYYEPKTIFEMQKLGGDWWRLYMVVGELFLELSSGGGTPEFVSTGYIMPPGVTSTVAINVEGTTCKIITGGEEFASFTFAGLPSKSAPGTLYFGCTSTGTEAFEGLFSHGMLLGSPASVANAVYPVWKYRRLSEKLGAIGLQEYATYEFPLEEISQRLYDLMTITMPSLGGWSV